MEEKELKGELLDQADVKVSGDKTEVYLTIKGNANKYTVGEILDILNKNNICYGISIENIQKMISNNINFISTLVARGTKPVDGVDGNFDFHFDIDENKKPIILEDGTVDYNKLGKIPMVTENDILVVYVEPVEGIDGIDVFGKTISARRGRPLNPLRGKGFKILEDGKTYVATQPGKAEFKGGKLNVRNLYVIAGNVDVTTGDVKFNGDILVTGNVEARARIEAAGSITVDGSVEAAELIAGKDVILRNGMQGQGFGYVNAKGNVSAKFFEQTKVVAGGDVNANTIMNCDVFSNKKVVVSGNKGAIVGGTVRAIESVDASLIGNKAEVMTAVKVGIDKNKLIEQLYQIDENITRIKTEVEEAEKKVKKLRTQFQAKNPGLVGNVQKEVMRMKISKTAELSKQMKLKEDLEDQNERCKGGTIKVNGMIFPNTKVFINGATEILRSEIRNIVIKNEKADIHMYSNNL